MMCLRVTKYTIKLQCFRHFANCSIFPTSGSNEAESGDGAIVVAHTAVRRALQKLTTLRTEVELMLQLEASARSVLRDLLESVQHATRAWARRGAVFCSRVTRDILGEEEDERGTQTAWLKIFGEEVVEFI